MARLRRAAACQQAGTALTAVQQPAREGKVGLSASVYWALSLQTSTLLGGMGAGEREEKEALHACIGFIGHVLIGTVWIYLQQRRRPSSQGASPFFTLA